MRNSLSVRAKTKNSINILFFSGYMYRYAKGVTQNFDKAMEFFVKSADQGNANSQYHLGIYYYYSSVDVYCLLDRVNL